VVGEVRPRLPGRDEVGLESLHKLAEGKTMKANTLIVTRNRKNFKGDTSAFNLMKELTG